MNNEELLQLGKCRSCNKEIDQIRSIIAYQRKNGAYKSTTKWSKFTTPELYAIIDRIKHTRKPYFHDYQEQDLVILGRLEHRHRTNDKRYHEKRYANPSYRKKHIARVLECTRRRMAIKLQTTDEK